MLPIQLSIFSAAEQNDICGIMRKFMAKPELAWKLDSYGYSCLHYAAQQNNFEIVEFILKLGSDPDLNSCGATPLHRAAFSGSFESCKLLLEYGADVHAIDTR